MKREKSTETTQSKANQHFNLKFSNSKFQSVKLVPFLSCKKTEFIATKTQISQQT